MRSGRRRAESAGARDWGKSVPLVRTEPTLLISYGVKDCGSALATVPLARVLRSIRPIESRHHSDTLSGYDCSPSPAPTIAALRNLHAGGGDVADLFSVRWPDPLLRGNDYLVAQCASACDLWGAQCAGFAPLFPRWLRNGWGKGKHKGAGCALKRVGREARGLRAEVARLVERGGDKEQRQKQAQGKQMLCIPKQAKPNNPAAASARSSWFRCSPWC